MCSRSQASSVRHSGLGAGFSQVPSKSSWPNEPHRYRRPRRRARPASGRAFLGDGEVGFNRHLVAGEADLRRAAD
jgi:hypothetical protein